MLLDLSDLFISMWGFSRSRGATSMPAPFCEVIKRVGDPRMIDLNFNHSIPIRNLPLWIDKTISFTVGNLNYMYPRPIELFIKWTLFFGIISVIGQIVFAGLMLLTKDQLQGYFAVGYVSCVLVFGFAFMFNFLNGAIVG